MPSYPAGMTVSNRALNMLTDALRHRRRTIGTRWRRLEAGQQALLVVAHLRNGETYPDLAGGFGIGTTTVFRYIREALDVLAALAATLSQAIEAARRKAFVILDGTLLRIDRVGMGAGRDRPYYSGRHKCLSVRVSSPLLRWLGILTAGDLALQVPAAFGLAHARVVPIAGGQGRPT